MREAAKNSHHKLWLEAMETKFDGKGEPLGRERFEEILGGYEVRLPPNPARGENLRRVIPVAPSSRPRV